MKMSEIKTFSPPKILIYSPAGRGKTALAMTLGADLHLIDMDGNLEVAFGLNDNLQSNRLEVDVKQFLDLDYPNKITAFDRVKAYIYGLPAEIKAGRFPFKFLGLDSLTALATGSQNQIMKNAARLGMAPTQPEWGLLLNEIESVITAIRALPIPVFILAHETNFTAENINLVQLAIPGQKLPGKITRMFSEIWYMRIRSIGKGDSEIFIQTLPTESVTCRSGRGLPNETKVATIHKNKPTTDSIPLLDIYNKLMGEKTT